MRGELLPTTPGFVPTPEVCTACGIPLVFEEEKVCVPGQLAAPWWPFGDRPTRLYHPQCVPADC